MNADPNTVATAAAAFAGAFLTFLVGRISKNWDARGQAEAALLGIAPPIIAELNKHIAQLNEQIEALWKRDYECRRELEKAKQRIFVLERKIGPQLKET